MVASHLIQFFLVVEKVKNQDNSFVLFRFYEIPDRKRADKISISTNSQSAVKSRDLRSNDKRVLNLKRAFEHKYSNGYMITKRGEDKPANKELIVDITSLGKWLMSWHSQRPNIAYSENKIFDKYFNQLFKKDYNVENIEALLFWSNEIRKCWDKDNPLSLNESLLAMKSYAPHHHLYAVSFAFCALNRMPELVPKPFITKKLAKKSELVGDIIYMAGTCLNTALEAATNEPQPENRVFSPQNWIKTKKCLSGIRQAVTQYFHMLPSMPNGIEINDKYKNTLKMENNDFENRWAAD